MAERRNDRVVIDTNVIVSLLLKEEFEFFVDLKYLYAVQLYTCTELLNELTQTLNYPQCRKYLKRPTKYYADFVKDFSEVIVIDQRFDRAPDIKDNFLFDLAYTAKSFYLISGDKPLLNMKQVNKIRIISFAEYRAMLKEK